MPSGTAAQPIALRIWSERKGVTAIAWHPTCHMEIHEQRGAQALHGLRAQPVGNPHALITLDDLQAVAEPLAALLLELPQQGDRGQAAGLDSLVWPRPPGPASGESPPTSTAPGFGRSRPSMGGRARDRRTLRQHFYVSFYKDLGGLAGAALAGDAALMAEAAHLIAQPGDLRNDAPVVFGPARSGREAAANPRVRRARARDRRRAGRVDGWRWCRTLRRPPCSTSCCAGSARLQRRGAHGRGGAQSVPVQRPGQDDVSTWHKHEVTVGESTLALPRPRRSRRCTRRSWSGRLSVKRPLPGDQRVVDLEQPGADLHRPLDAPGRDAGVGEPSFR